MALKPRKRYTSIYERRLHIACRYIKLSWVEPKNKNISEWLDFWVDLSKDLVIEGFIDE